MTVAVLGSGNVATHLVKKLNKTDFKVKQVWSRNYQKAILLSNNTGTNAIEYIHELDDEVDIILIAVADAAIEFVVKQIPSKFNQKLILHTSGSLALSVLEKYSTQIGVLYPLQTFSKKTELDFFNIPLCIEANQDNALKTLSLLAHQLSQNVSIIKSSDRLTLHIAAVFACNFTNCFYGIAEDLLKDKNLNFSLLHPLILETANKVILNSPAKVQTGPAKRNDQITLNKHLLALKNQPQTQEIYHLLSQYIVKKFQIADLGNK